MPYITQQDMIDRYGEEELIQLTDHNNLREINTDTLDRAIADAEGEVDGYLAGRFSAPITPVPKVLVRITSDIARYYLYDDMAPEHISKRYDNAVKFLKGIANGTVNLGVDDTGATPDSKNDVQMESGGHTFGRDDTGFI